MGKYIAVTSSEEPGCKVGYDEGEYTRALLEHEIYDACEALNAKPALGERSEPPTAVLGEADSNELREAFLKFVGAAVTVKRENTDEWMEWFEREINMTLRMLKDPDRVEYNKRSGDMNKAVSA